MEPNASFSNHHRGLSSYTDRYNSLFSHPVPSTTATGSSDRDELSEDDIFWTGDDFYESNRHCRRKTSDSNIPSTSSTPPSSSSLSRDRHRNKGFSPAEAFGILAVLSENKNGRGNRSLFNHKVSTSSSSTASSSSSSSRMIPVLPRPPTIIDRHLSMPTRNHQSAPVNVPISTINSGKRRQGSLFDNDDNDDEEDYGYREEGQILPPHEIVSRRLANSPLVSCSVLEGTGRTLKGQDLRRVRNAVFRQTDVYCLVEGILHLHNSLALNGNERRILAYPDISWFMMSCTAMRFLYS